MKTTKSFTVDAEVYSKARAKYRNLSERIEELLRADVTADGGEKSEAELQAEVKRQESIIATLNADLVHAKKEADEKPKHNFDAPEED